ncbi:MAG: hypothetical protein J0M33_00365 [Anaerolineae bacterium]|nr:hypothetical protein [Anaerolineae bacterium]
MRDLVSVWDKTFLNLIEQWFLERNEVFVVARLSRVGGGRIYFWFSNFTSFTDQLRVFPPETDVIVFRNDLLPLRGHVTLDLIKQALTIIPDHIETMVVPALKPTNTDLHVWGCDNHAELQETLQDLRGQPVSVGYYPPWHESDNDEMISAIVPFTDGTLKRGVY